MAHHKVVKVVIDTDKAELYCECGEVFSGATEYAAELAYQRHKPSMSAKERST